MNKKLAMQKYFNQAGKLNMTDKNYRRQVKFLLDFFLREDLAGKGDITSKILVADKINAQARIVAKQSGVLAGLQEVLWFLKKHKIKCQAKAKDGEQIVKGQTILVLRGKLRKILALERIILNVLQRMSGIATATAKLVRKTNHQVLICPTRKTLWGLLDKRAVVCGHGGTHRLGLYDFVLIKENHLKADKLTGKQINKLTKVFWEVEVEDGEQALQMARLSPSAIMFDDFKPARIRTVINKIRKIDSNIIFEASGGIDEKNISQYAKIGVDVISLGALTNSVKSLDFGLYVINIF